MARTLGYKIARSRTLFAKTADKVLTPIIDAILSDLSKHEAEIDRVWAVEARRRWVEYKAGRLSTVSYEEVMARHRG